LIATPLGAGAAAVLERGESGVLIGLIRSEVTATPLKEVVGVQKPIDPKLV
jgi:6-phosphofructokinase 1